MYGPVLLRSAGRCLALLPGSPMGDRDDWLRGNAVVRAD